MFHGRRSDGDKIGFLGGSSERFCPAFYAVSGKIVSLGGQHAHHFIGASRHPGVPPVEVDGLADDEFVGHDLTASLTFFSDRVRTALAQIDACNSGVPRQAESETSRACRVSVFSARTPRPLAVRGVRPALPVHPWSRRAIGDAVVRRLLGYQPRICRSVDLQQPRM